MPRRTILDAHVHNGVGPSVTVKPWSARLFYSVQRRSDDPLAHPRGHRKSRIAPQCRIAVHGGWIEDTRPVRRRFLSHPPRPTLSSPRREAGPASAASRPASLKPSAGESAAQAAALLGNSLAEDEGEVSSHVIVSRS